MSNSHAGLLLLLFLIVCRIVLCPEPHFFLMALRRHVNVPLFLAAEKIAVILKKDKVFKTALPGECSILGMKV